MIFRSEGNFLTQNDERSYWGKIHEVIHKRNRLNENKGEHDATIERKLEIRGSVMFGWGLEPEPVGKFTMIEQTEILDDDDDYDENDSDNFQEYDVNNKGDKKKNVEGDDDKFFDSIFE